MSVSLDQRRNKRVITIGPHRHWFDLRLSELWRARELILMFVRRDLLAVYRQTLLGPLWFVLQPIMVTAIFTVVFARVARVPTDNAPPVLFYLCGIVAWNLFANSFRQVSTALIDNARLYGKVYFHRLAIPLSLVLSNIVQFLIQALLCAVVYLYFSHTTATIHPNAYAALIPVCVAQLGLLGLACGLLVSALTTKYRDLTFLTGFGVQLWMYATPIIYPASQVPTSLRWVLLLNPVAPVIEIVRHGLIGSGTIAPEQVLIGFLSTLALLLLGLLSFSRVEGRFVDFV